MSVDFSNEPIGKPRWCITRGGRVKQAWRDDDQEWPVCSIQMDEGGVGHKLDGTTDYCDPVHGDETLVSFAPPECDSFTWKAPEPIKVGDWVEVVSEQYNDVPVGTKAQVTSIDRDGDAWLSGSVSSKRQSTCWSPKWLRKCDPPSPTYRPYANAEEFLPHADRWMRYTQNDKNHHIRCDAFNDKGICLSGETTLFSYSDLVQEHVFADTNEPCGVKVDA